MQDMSENDIRAMISQSRVGHLGLADGGVAYTIPIFYGHDGRTFYFHAHPGLKDEYIESTKVACFVITRVQSLEDWASVMAFGKMHEVLDNEERLVALDALMAVPLPPEFGVSEMGEPARSSENVRIFGLTPQRITGRMSASAAPSEEEREIGIGGM